MLVCHEFIRWNCKPLQPSVRQVDKDIQAPNPCADLLCPSRSEPTCNLCILLKRRQPMELILNQWLPFDRSKQAFRLREGTQPTCVDRRLLARDLTSSCEGQLPHGQARLRHGKRTNRAENAPEHASIQTTPSQHRASSLDRHRQPRQTIPTRRLWRRWPNCDYGAWKLGLLVVLTRKF